ncbi:GTPase, partial [Catenibacterium sp.]|uniref:GTPase n=1 Tax=Catenibacterium sp. TaxID=2049022 RepID=UPI0040271538
LNTFLRRQFKEYGIKPLDVVITSGKKNMNFDEIFDKIDEYRHGRDVYVVGITNVGKSTFINRMLKNYSDASNLITTSEFPGTTLDLIKIPLDDHSSLYDTPGIMNEHQYTSVVDEKDLAYIMPQGEVKPMIYQLNDDQSIFFSGLARIDYTKGDKGNFICYFSRNMQIHRTKTEKADELFNRHKQLQVYGPASSMKEMKAYEFTLPEEKRDIVISGLGFICIHAPKGKIKVYVPEGIDVFMRESLI